MKNRILIAIGAVFAFVIIGFLGNWAWKYYGLPSVPGKYEYESLEERAYAALGFAQSHDMNTHYAMFVDYSLPSGTPRLFVWDFHKKEVVARTYMGTCEFREEEHVVMELCV